MSRKAAAEEMSTAGEAAMTILDRIEEQARAGGIGGGVQSLAEAFALLVPERDRDSKLAEAQARAQLAILEAIPRLMGGWGSGQIELDRLGDQVRSYAAGFATLREVGDRPKPNIHV